MDNIKRSFRLLAKKSHPDTHTNNPKAAALFAALKAAHDVHGDEASAISGLTLSVTGLMVAVAIIVASPLIMRTLMPLIRSDVGNAVSSPPKGFSGLIDLAVELRRADDLMVHAGSLHCEWPQKPTVPPVPMHTAESLAITVNSDDKITPTGALTDQNAIHHAPASQPGHAQIDFLIGRGEKLLSEGNVGAARNLLQRAAEARDARAALDLGATYDPTMLAMLGARGVAADVPLARDWYEKASALGSREARERLNLLTSAKVDGTATLPPIITQAVASAPIESAGSIAVSDNVANKAVTSPAPMNQSAIRNAVGSQLDDEQIELLLARSQQLVSQGDIGAARTLLQRAAEARDARAALALGATYDPIMLAILKARGVAADVSLARDWYKKASEFGSREARERLKLLTSAKVDGGESVGHRQVLW